MAVVGVAPTSTGVWQYSRGNWTVQEDVSTQYDNIWLNFPPGISDENSLLLHGNDRLRFMPHPHAYWTASLAPSIRVKTWDNTLGEFSDASSFPAEVSTMTVNTDALVDTLQSLHRPIGLFSSAVATVTAARYGCDGGVNSAHVHDQCCECGGGGETCEGCDGTRGSNVGVDSCDVCGGPSSCLGCDFIPFSGTEPTQCQVCLSQVSVPTPDLMLALSSRFSPSAFADCQGDCRGNALLDDCSVCSGGGTSHDFNSDVDCAGVCFGNATIDTCGDCTGPGTVLPLFNQNLDCTGVCNGRFLADSCGVCQLPGRRGVVRENRDCSGECYGVATVDSCGVCHGGNTNVSVDSDLDACGVCGGDNTTCMGCDGGVASGRSLDRCGHCGGNDCGCYQLSSVTPNRGPISGGTRVLVEGAGFFLNDTSLLGFLFDPDLPNCGAPLQFPDESAIRIICLFSLSTENEVLQVFGEPINQSTIVCPTRDSAFSGAFSVQVRINGGPFSNPVEYQYDDYSTITLRTMTPVQWELNSDPTLSFHGDGFINSSSLSCLLYNGHMCSDPPSPLPPGGYTSIPAVFVSPTEARCVLPPATTSCRVTVRLSFDGQESGRVESDTADFTFTYRSIAPQVTNVNFLDDLSGLLIQFDRPAETTDQSTSPVCMDIFDSATLALLGGSRASCSWSNSRQDGLSVLLPDNAMVRVRSPITFKNGAIETRRVLYSFSLTNLTVNVSPDSVHPLAVIDGPDSIPFCGQVSFSGLHSLYVGYSGLEYNWAILVEDSTIPGYSDISQYLDSLGANVGLISLDTAHFMDDVEYSVQLQVVNSAGLQSRTSMQLRKDLQPKLDVVLLGSQNLSINFGESLVVNSLVLEPECRDQGTLQFSWELVRVTDERRDITVTEDITDIKAGLLHITVPASRFQENARYDLQVVVSSSDPPDVGRAEVRVNVLPSPLTVRIHGGNRTVSTSSDVVLDARNSTYSAVLSDPTFTWICAVVGSLDACYNTTATADIPIPISLPGASFVTFPSSSLTSGQSYQFTLRMDQEETTAEGGVVVDVVSSPVPMVEVSALASALLLSEEVTLSGFVFSETPLLSVSWESIQLEGEKACVKILQCTWGGGGVVGNSTSTDSALS